jgi:dynein light chain Tctex-type 1
VQKSFRKFSKKNNQNKTPMA